MRIEDLSEDEQQEDEDATPIYKNVLQRSSNVTDDKEVNGKTVETKSADIRKMISNMNKLNK